MVRPILSVIICTHNPRTQYLERVLSALRDQSLPFSDWELLLIDNASVEPLADRFDIGWHPNGRQIKENELGLSPARLRGVTESMADLLLFVDDDNILRSDYLAHCRRIADEFPYLGTWGGQCIPEFESQPAAELEPYLGGLALRTAERDSWTNIAGGWSDAYPFGAGLCVRRAVADEFHRRTQICPLRRSLERRGQSLLSGQDYDISLTACDMGLGCGVFKDLALVHIMPAVRVSSSYLLRLAHAHAFSNAMLFTARGNPPRDPLITPLRRYYHKIRLSRQPYPSRAFAWAQMVGTHEGLEYCRRLVASSSDRAVSRRANSVKLAPPTPAAAVP